MLSQTLTSDFSFSLVNLSSCLQGMFPKVFSSVEECLGSPSQMSVTGQRCQTFLLQSGHHSFFFSAPFLLDFCLLEFPEERQNNIQELFCLLKTWFFKFLKVAIISISQPLVLQNKFPQFLQLGLYSDFQSFRFFQCV